jgi:hypothetical protein
MQLEGAAADALRAAVLLTMCTFSCTYICFPLLLLLLLLAVVVVLFTQLLLLFCSAAVIGLAWLATGTSESMVIIFHIGGKRYRRMSCYMASRDL